MVKTIFITGANGFLGRSLKTYLEQYPTLYKSFSLVRKESYQKDVFSCSFENTEGLRKILQKVRPHIIFHAAGGRFEDAGKTLESNVMTTLRLLEVIKSLKMKTVRVVIPSSAAEYGNIQQKKLISEENPSGPLAWYGFVKKTQVQLALNYIHDGLDVVIARIFNVIGAQTPATLGMGNFAWQIAAIEAGRQKSNIRTMNIEGKRDFLDIDDICSGCLVVATRGAKGQAYNICSSKGVSIRSLLQKLISYSSVKNIHIKENRKASVGSFDMIGSNKKLQSLGWQPRISLEESLQRTLSSYRNQS